MYDGETVAVVVPAYNEEGFVGSVIDAVPAFVDRIYAIDDCSTDRTWEEIQRRAGREDHDAVPAKADGGERVSRVVPIRHEENRGVGAAIKTGYRRALREEIDVTAVVAGDGQMDPGILDRFVEPIADGTADYAKGDRLQSPQLRAEMSAWRSFGNGLLTFLTKVASGYWKMNDPQNGYTAISLAALERIDIDALYDGFGFSNHLLITLNAYSFRVVDIPMKAVYGSEESHIRYSTFVPSLAALLFVGFLWRLKTKYFVLDFHPLVFLYLLGTVGGLAGAVYGTVAMLRGASLLVSGISLLLLLFSGALIVFAMVFDMQYNNHLQKRTSY